MFAEIWASADFAEVCFLVAVILGVIATLAALTAYRRDPDPGFSLWATPLAYGALTALALGWLAQPTVPV